MPSRQIVGLFIRNIVNIIIVQIHTKKKETGNQLVESNSLGIFHLKDSFPGRKGLQHSALVKGSIPSLITNSFFISKTNCHLNIRKKGPNKFTSVFFCRKSTILNVIVWFKSFHLLSCMLLYSNKTNFLYKLYHFYSRKWKK